LITIVFITTAALPIITTLFMYQRGMVSSLEMETPSERNWPFVSTAIYYFMGYYLISQLPVPAVLADMVLGAAVAIIFSWMINFRWKISIHMVGVGGVVGLLIGFSTKLDAGLVGPVLLAVFLAGCLGFARLAVGAHSHAQVYCGFFLGLICEWWIVGAG
jgi:putative flippase GtrA